MSFTADFLRPPGVVSEKELKARCTSCGRCVAVCVFKCLELTPDSLFGPDTPKVFQRKAPCFLCMKCSDICPTGALHKVPLEGARMGMAFLDQKKCVDYQEQNHVMCWTCYERCPMKAKAIVLQNGYTPTVTMDCVGCGVCEYVCPVKAITVAPIRMLEKEENA